jgi:hypothetical protein
MGSLTFMTLNEWSAEKRLLILEDLSSGRTPSLGRFDETIFKEGQVKGSPQMGAVLYFPQLVTFEFIFPDPLSSATVLSVSVVPPERIVFLPVPSWVIENVWQGEVQGSFHFESHARELVERFALELDEVRNLKWFGDQGPKRRE